MNTLETIVALIHEMAHLYSYIRINDRNKQVMNSYMTITGELYSHYMEL